MPRPILYALVCATALAVVSLVAVSAQAQVAAPGLLPDSFVTTNPAAMQFGGESRVGGTYAQGKDESDDGDLDTEGWRLGFRGLWSWGGLAGEIEHEQDAGGDGELKNDVRRAALSLLPLEFLAVGAVYQGVDFEQTDATGLTVEADSELVAFGASAQVFEVVYVGYAQGEEEADFALSADTVPPLGFEFSDKRKVSAWGVALRGGMDLRYHVEYSELEFKPFEYGPNDLDPDGGEVDEHFDQHLVLELGWRGLLAGVELVESDHKSNETDIHTQRYSVAWVPAGGYGIVYSYETSETEDQDTGDTTDESTAHALSLVYLF